MNTKEKIPARLLAFAARSNLSSKAWMSRTTTYEELAGRLNEHAANNEYLTFPTSGNAMASAIAEVLTQVFDWCKEHELPPLTAIVVRKSGQHKGLPGKGFWDLMGIEMTDFTTAELRQKHQEILKEVFDFWDI